MMSYETMLVNNEENGFTIYASNIFSSLDVKFNDRKTYEMWILLSFTNIIELFTQERPQHFRYHDPFPSGYICLLGTHAISML